MPKSPELPQLVAQKFRSEPRPDRRQSNQFDVYTYEYDPPKEIVFREGSDLLSEREYDVMALVIDGKSDREIGLELCLSFRTVKNHLTSIANKIKDRLKSLEIELTNDYGRARGRIWKINELLRLGELELRDPKTQLELRDPKTQEELPQLVPQDNKVVARPNRKSGNQFDAYITQYKTPKEIVFSENASLLTPREKEVVVNEYEGKTRKQTAMSMGIAIGTCMNHKTNIRDKIESHFESLDIKPPHSGNLRDSIWVINSLLQLGELELRDPD